MWIISWNFSAQEKMGRGDQLPVHTNDKSCDTIWLSIDLKLFRAGFSKNGTMRSSHNALGDVNRTYIMLPWIQLFLNLFFSRYFFTLWQIGLIRSNPN